MKRLLFYFFLPLVYLISWTPWRIMYLISDGLYLIVYYIWGYRKKVVIKNLKNSFPEKSEKEINQITKAYYRYLSDLIFESLKLLTISAEDLEKRVVLNDISVCDQFYNEKQSFISMLGHLGNWELYGSRFSLSSPFDHYAIYHPIKQPQVNSLVKRLRTRLGTKLYPMKETFKGMLANRNKPSVTSFIADQTPPKRNAYWIKFLNQDTAVFTGAEKMAKKLNYPVVYFSAKRLKRGYYELNASLIENDPANAIEGSITKKYFQLLEADIVSRPANWLWSHRRWKHKKEA